MNKKIIKQDDKKLKKAHILQLCNNVLKATNGSIKLSLTRIRKNIINQNQEIERLKIHHKEFKDAVVAYHMNYIEKSKVEERAFLNALQMSNIDGPPLDDILEQQIKNIKENEAPNLNSPCFSPNTSSYKPQTQTLSALKRKANEQSYMGSGKVCDRSLVSLLSRESSPCSSVNSPIHLASRFPGCNLNHVFSMNVITGKTCFICRRNVSKQHMRKCQECGAYIHNECSTPGSSQLCISLQKTGLKFPSQPRSLSLHDLCGRQSSRVPNVLLVVMNSVQKLGLTTSGIYGTDGKEREARELCARLLDGKLKSLVKADVRTAASAMILLLRSFREPLLTDSVIRSLEGRDADDQVAESLRGLSTETRDTLAHVLLHLQIISNSPACQLDSEKLARIFSPALTDSSNLRTVRVVKMLIDRPSKFYDQYFLNESVFFAAYLKSV